MSKVEEKGSGGPTDNVGPKEVVKRPVNRKITQREHEINQLKRRYATLKIDGEKYSFPFAPTDPDFPYTLPNLTFTFTVPADYPKTPVTLDIHGLEVGFARNIERGFTDSGACYGWGNRGLLGSITWLDRNIEGLLALPKSETIKIVKPRTTISLPRAHRNVEVSDDRDEEVEVTMARNIALTKIGVHPSCFNKTRMGITSNGHEIGLYVPPTWPHQGATATIGNKKIPLSNDLKASIDGLTKDMNSVKFEEVVDGEYDDSFKPMVGHTYVHCDDTLSSTESSSSTSEEDIETDAKEKGTAMNAIIEMEGIAMLQVSTLQLIVKCLRCKGTIEVTLSQSTTKACPTCSTIQSIAFRKIPIIRGSTRIGYLDMEGCSALSLGPMTCSPTCDCGHLGEQIKGLVPGQSQTRPCRACFAKQKISITTTSFLIITHASKSSIAKKEKKVVVGGRELPGTGTCRHYKRSHRWFRFPCCGQVFACDICHDKLTDHEATELAKSQVCGWCSREQPMSSTCKFCAKTLLKTSSRSGFWEGGKGTRDQSRMNRGDRRKYRRNLNTVKQKGPSHTKKKIDR